MYFREIKGVLFFEGITQKSDHVGIKNNYNWSQ